MAVSHTVQRIACLQPSATVILDRVGELERVVACTRYCADVVPAVRTAGRVILARVLHSRRIFEYSGARAAARD